MADRLNDPDNLNDRTDLDDLNDLPPDESSDSGTETAQASSTPDPNDEVPVPIAMWPSEIDERAQVVDALRGKGPPPRTDTQVDPLADSPADRAQPM